MLHANNVLTGLFPEEGYCPALDVLDDCAAAREAGLHLDMEALYMCNRHQMCYTCVRKNSSFFKVAVKYEVIMRDKKRP